MRTLLEDVLLELECSQAEMSRMIGVSTKHMCLLVAGTASMSGEIALRLQHATCVEATRFLADDIPRVLARAREKRRSLHCHDSSEDGCDGGVQQRDVW